MKNVEMVNVLCSKENNKSGCIGSPFGFTVIVQLVKWVGQPIHITYYMEKKNANCKLELTLWVNYNWSNMSCVVYGNI